MGTFDLRQFSGAEPLADAAAADCLRAVQAPHAAPHFSLALSGGRIARNFCSALARLCVNRGSLARVAFFWSDERCVPPENEESNFRLANEALLRPLEIPGSQIHRIRGEIDPAEACTRAVSELTEIVGQGPSSQPVLDLVLLGMGEDGHVASLFPGEPEGEMADAAVYRCVTAVKPPPLRITLGYGAISAARDVWVLASGAGKAEALRESLRSRGGTPLARVLRLRASVRIYTDIALSPRSRA